MQYAVAGSEKPAGFALGNGHLAYSSSGVGGLPATLPLLSAFGFPQEQEPHHKSRAPESPESTAGCSLPMFYHGPPHATRPMVTHSPHVNEVAWCKSKTGADGGMAAPAPVPSKCSDDGVWIAFWDANRRAHPLNCHPEGPQRPQSRCHRSPRYLPTHIGSVKT